MSNDKPYAVITTRILDALESGDVPWRKPWSLPAGMRPQSVTGHAYRGINALVLGLSGYTDPRWLTYRKALELDGHVRRGEKSMPVALWKPIERQDDDGETKVYWLFRYYSVFNVGQCEDLNIPELEVADMPDIDPIAEAEKIIAEMPDPPTIANDGLDRAYYVPTYDAIHLPPLMTFEGADEYYSTAFHELGHSTGHAKRLDRDMGKTLAPFGSPVYSKEELVAEFTSAFLCHESGIANTIENSAAYIQGWSRKLKEEPRLLVQSASLGEKAAQHILGKGE